MGLIQLCGIHKNGKQVHIDRSNDGIKGQDVSRDLDTSSDRHSTKLVGNSTGINFKDTTVIGPNVNVITQESAVKEFIKDIPKAK